MMQENFVGEIAKFSPGCGPVCTPTVTLDMCTPIATGFDAISNVEKMPSYYLFVSENRLQLISRFLLLHQIRISNV